MRQSELLYLDPAQPHEITHGLRMIEGVENFGIQRTLTGYCTWRREPFLSPLHEVSSTLAGQLVEMLASGVIHYTMPKDFVRNASSTVIDSTISFLRANHDGSTTDDCSFLLRQSRETLFQAFSTALSAARRVYYVWQGAPARFQTMFDVIDRLEPHQVLVVDQHALDALLNPCAGVCECPIVPFSRWYADVTPEQDDARNEELRLESMRILDEMIRLGQISGGRLTEAGLARLELNERS